MFLIANTFAICFNKDYLLTYLLSLIVSEIFSVWKSRPWNHGEGQSLSLKVVPFDTLECSIVTLSLRNILLQKCCDFEAVKVIENVTIR